MTRRFYSGARGGTKKLGEAARLTRLEMEKGGKLPMSTQDRYKRILKKKLEESREKASASKPLFQLPGTAPMQRKMSKRAEQALKEIAARKAAKEEQELRRSVIVQPRHFSDAGRIDAKGNAYDLGNNLTLKVDLKTGTIKTSTGWTVGKYKAKNKYMTNMLITDALKKHGAYFIQQRRLQLLQEQQRQAELAMQGLSIYGVPNNQGLASQMFLDQYGNTDIHGSDTYDARNDALSSQRAAAAAVGAWGAMSNNVHGTYADNAWGGMMDNVWGGVNNNIWGGIGGSSWGSGSSRAWSHRPWKIWGSGAPGQKNWLKPLGALFVGLFGFGRIKGLDRARGNRNGQTRSRSR